MSTRIPREDEEDEEAEEEEEDNAPSPSPPTPMGVTKHVKIVVRMARVQVSWPKQTRVSPSARRSRLVRLLGAMPRDSEPSGSSVPPPNSFVVVVYVAC
eukprot:9490237-Pyramimonas_sp.AAC.1